MTTSQIVVLRPPFPVDLAALFEHQLDPEANRMAGTRPRSPDAFRAVWERNMADPSVVARVIVLDGAVAGGVSCFPNEGVDMVGYWIGRAHWGRGVASDALRLFLQEVTRRPLHAHTSAANPASMRVLVKNGFRETGRFVDAGSDRYLAGEVVTFLLE